MKFGIVVFPGSNCDHDVYHVAKHVLGHEAAFLWHKDAAFGGIDCVVLPGGFAHGDYLRTGAIARFSPIMKPIEAFAARGGLVLGISATTLWRKMTRRSVEPSSRAAVTKSSPLRAKNRPRTSRARPVQARSETMRVTMK